jgi:hypothetical protein
MSLTSILKPDQAVLAGLAEAGAVYVIYQAALPNHADIRSADAHNTDIEASRKRAAWMAAGVLGIVFLMTKDLNSFLIGGLALGGIDILTKHANAVSPATGKMVAPAGKPGDVNSFPMPDFTGQDDQSAGAYA